MNKEEALKTIDQKIKTLWDDHVDASGVEKSRIHEAIKAQSYSYFRIKYTT